MYKILVNEVLTGKADKIVGILIGILKGNPHVEFAYLFGSRARGKAGERNVGSRELCVFDTQKMRVSDIQDERKAKGY